MEKEIIDIFKNKIKDKIAKIDGFIDFYLNDYNEDKISYYVEHKKIWLWCLDILSETEREIYNKEKE